MEQENTMQALNAVGASVSANCQLCLESTVRMARKSGANEQEIAEAIEVGKTIRRDAGSKMDTFASAPIVASHHGGRSKQQLGMWSSIKTITEG